MKVVCCGLLSEILLARMHERTEAYLSETGYARAALVEECRSQATVPDLAHRILARTIYSQASSRVATFRELVQNALDASPPGARIDVHSSDDGREIFVIDRGCGMTREDLLQNLIVPFRSGKDGNPSMIGEHGIGFFSALEIAPWLEVTTRTNDETFRLRVAPIGAGPPYSDFSWTLGVSESAPREPKGTTLHLWLAQRITRTALAADVLAAAGLVDPLVARIYVDGMLINASRSRMRRVARTPIQVPPPSGQGPLLRIGDIELYVGRCDGIEPRFAVTQGGLVVGVRVDGFSAPELSIHRDLARAILSAGFTLVAELPLSVPLNKGRSAVAGHLSRAVDHALVAAFERFVLEDALYNRDLLRAVDHRLSAILDRLVSAAFAGEHKAATADTEDLTPILRARVQDRSASPKSEPAARVPTVAAPEDVVRFAGALLDAPVFNVATWDSALRETRRPMTLREILVSHRAGALRPLGSSRVPGLVYLVLQDPLAAALWHRLSADTTGGMHAAADAEAQRSRGRSVSMQRIGRDALLGVVSTVRGAPALAAVLSVLELMDATLSRAASLNPSPISVHQDLYGPDEMAHTDGNGISVNFASPRVRALLSAVLTSDNEVAFSALMDLFVHEKTHVSLASFVPHATAEHGTTFYRRKDLLRRKLLQAIATGTVADPIGGLATARAGLASPELPSPAVLATTFNPAVAA
jgi:hypothetical protein